MEKKKRKSSSLSRLLTSYGWTKPIYRRRPSKSNFILSLSSYSQFFALNKKKAFFNKRLHNKRKYLPRRDRELLSLIFYPNGSHKLGFMRSPGENFVRSKYSLLRSR